MELVLSVRGPDLGVQVRRYSQAQVEIGRGPQALLRLDDPGVSGAHARFIRQAEGYLVVDEGSAHGSWLGDERLAPHAPAPVAQGDVLRIGPYTVEVHVDDGEGFTTDARDSRHLVAALVVTPPPASAPTAPPWTVPEIAGVVVAVGALAAAASLLLQ